MLRTVSLAFLILFAVVTSSVAAAPKARQITAVRVDTPPKIDGRLEDPVWQKAEPSGEFTQLKPDRGKPMSG